MDENMVYVKALLKRATLKKQIFTTFFAVLGLMYSILLIAKGAVDIKNFFVYIGFIIVLFFALQGMFLLSNWLLTHNSTVYETEIVELRGIGNGKTLVVEIEGKKRECNYYIRNIRGLYKGSEVLVVVRNNPFYSTSFPIVFPGR